jgi:hypothetical protein
MHAFLQVSQVVGITGQSERVRDNPGPITDIIPIRNSRQVRID